MILADRKLLEYLHDATVLKVVYDAENRNSRTMTLFVKCDPDAGYPAWDGKYLSLRLESVVLLSFFAFGSVIGEEQINTWGDKVSEAMKSELTRLRAAGCDCTGERFVISFHSGSVLEGLCQGINVEEGPP